MSQSFETLGLEAGILRAVSEQGYTQPTPIQARAIPLVLQGRDVLAGAQTGTGKTAGFTLPLLHRLMTQGARAQGRKAPRALILTPTRELAAQVHDSVRGYGKYLPLRTTMIFGGVGMHPQIDALRRGVDIVVATPGRLLDHVQQRTIDLSKIEILVLDEADRMLDMGFIHDIRRVLALLPKQRQNLLFSATFSSEIQALAATFLHDPELVEVARRNADSELVAQRIHPVDQSRKRELLTQLIDEGHWQQVLVFMRTKHGANRLAEQLTHSAITAAAIHGNKSQGARTRALTDFKKGKVRVLVATDIAARGLDIVELPYVVNFELPNVAEDYVHRIGRTGRAGSHGIAISLVSRDEEALLRDIERLLGRKLDRETVPGFERTAGPAAPTAAPRGRGAQPAHRATPRNGSERARNDTRRDAQRPARDSKRPHDASPATRRDNAPRRDAPRTAQSARKQTPALLRG